MQPSGAPAADRARGPIFEGFQCRPELRRPVVSYRLVCRIAHDSNAHHPCHPHEPYPFRAVASLLAIDDDDHTYHGDWRLPALLSTGGGAGLCPAASALLAAPAGDLALLRRLDPTRQDLADPQVMDLRFGNHEEEALKKGMEEKSRGFTEKGSELYVTA